MTTSETPFAFGRLVMASHQSSLHLLANVQCVGAKVLPNLCKHVLRLLYCRFQEESYASFEEGNYAFPATFLPWLVLRAKPFAGVLYAYAAEKPLRWQDVLTASCSLEATEDLMRMYPQTFWEVVSTNDMFSYLCQTHILLNPGGDQFRVVKKLLSDPRFPIYKRTSQDAFSTKPILHLLLARVQSGVRNALLLPEFPARRSLYEQQLTKVSVFRDIARVMVSRSDFDAFARDGESENTGKTAGQAFAVLSSDNEEAAADELLDFVNTAST